MKNGLINRIMKGLAIPAVLATGMALAGCNTVPVNYLEESADKAYNTQVREAYPSRPQIAEIDSLAKTDDVLHGCPVERKVLENGLAKYSLGEVWGPKERAQFSDWKEEYRELARQVDESGKSPEGAALVLLDNTMKEAWMSKRIIPKEESPQNGISNVLTIYEEDGKPEYVAQDPSFGQNTMRLMADIEAGSAKIKKYKDYLLIIPVKNPKLGKMSEYDSATYYHRFLEGLCKDADRNGNHILTDIEIKDTFKNFLRNYRKYEFEASRDIPATTSGGIAFSVTKYPNF